MNIGLFILYYLICTIVLVLITLFIIRFIFKKKCNIISRVAEKTINDYFKAYDTDNLTDIFNLDETKETLNLNDNFEEEINIIDEDSPDSNPTDSNKPSFF